ncbi:MAG: O-6-methylguanine methyltransferase [Bacteroidetes bacterium]|nr:O-6-methylguanine methyltransferase [Bacteroidota bacterium]
MNYTCYIESPVGLIEISGDDEFVNSVLFVDRAIKEESEVLSDAVKECKQQLSEYFEGKRKSFELSLSQTGTDFQQKVWGQLMTIPFGKTVSYMQMAKALGDPKCIRAAGTANGKNQLAIIVPCHRVVGSNGMLVGYAGGLNRKRWLLDFEARMSGALTLGL